MKNVIIIPSKGRSDIDRLSRLSIWYAKHSGVESYIMCCAAEANDYEKFGFELIVRETPTVAHAYDEGIKWAQENNVGKVCFMDDDLLIGYRRDFSKPNIYALELSEFSEMFYKIFTMCDGMFPIVSLRHRRFAQSEEHAVRFNRKLIGILCCNVATLADRKFEWGHQSMFDHNMVLTLLSEGFANVQICEYTLDDALGYFAKGGCATYRTPKGHSESALALAKKFDGVTNRFKYNSLGEALTDVVIRPSKVFNETKFRERFGVTFKSAENSATLLYSGLE